MIKQYKTSNAVGKPFLGCRGGGWIWLLAVCLAILPCATWAYGGRNATDLKLLEANIQRAIEIAKPATVAIQEAAPNRPGFFSGVIVSSEGHILSVGHAVRVGAFYKVHLPDGRSFRAQGLGRNNSYDCAMIKIVDKDSWPFLELGDSSNLVVDQPVIGLSHPGNFRNDRGLVVRFGTIVRPVTSRFGMIQSSVLMEPGDSGGPLIDLEGRVVGIHSQITQSLRENYEVAADTYRVYWDELNQPSEFRVDRVPGLPYLGFEIRRGRRSGSKVQSVDPDSPAARAGLQVGDIITSIEGATRGASLERIFDRFLNGDRDIEMTLQREQSSLRIQLPIQEADVELPFDSTAPRSSAVAAQTQFRVPNLTAATDSIESRLDDMVVSIFSELEGQGQAIFGLAIGQDFILTKNSAVGPSPKIQPPASTLLPSSGPLPLEVIQRDEELDLCLLRSPQKLSGLPVESLNAAAQPSKLGSLLISPRPNEGGVVSVLGSRQFRAHRDVQNRGYLGVELETDDNLVYLKDVFPNGAAANAGLKPGDQLVRLGDMEVRTAEEVHTFLRKTMASQRVTVMVLRDGQSLSKNAVLGSVPTQHVADFFDGGKSPRRDGFPTVFCHDAILLPHECGGPVFDLDGNLVGLNIARVSRTHCYAIPLSTLANFWERHRPQP